MSGAAWREKPGSARLVRALVRFGPVVASVIAGIVLARIWTPPNGATIAVWGMAILAASTVALFAVDRAVRRLLPLATMLELSMVFPDRLPSRFKLALQAGSGRKRERDLQRLTEGNPGLQEAAELLLALVTSLGDHDRRTRGHSERVRAFSELLGVELGLPVGELEKLRWSALLHDVGKVTIPASILNKEGRLNDDEWSLIRNHPAEGARLVEPLRPWLGDWLASVDQHHERWDGSGYPNGLAGKQIAYPARIVAVADAFEVMTSRRSYRDPIPPDEARKELVRSESSQFDPEIVRALLSVSLGKLERVVAAASWMIQFLFLAGAPLPPRDLPGVPDVDPGSPIAMGHHPAAAHHPAAHHHGAAHAHPDASGSDDGGQGNDDLAVQDHLRREEQEG